MKVSRTVRLSILILCLAIKALSRSEVVVISSLGRLGGLTAGSRISARPVYEVSEGASLPPCSTYENAGSLQAIDAHVDILPFFRRADKLEGLRQTANFKHPSEGKVFPVGWKQISRYC